MRSRGLVLIALWALALVAAPTARAGVTTLEPSYEVAVERNVVVPMSDGTRLVADVYRPVPKPGQPAAQRFPCLFEMTPYRKEMRAAEAAGFFPARGFVYMEVDARGTGGSEGEYDGVFLRQEQEDGYDAIEWLATRYPHCSGQVGMWGGSYSGINQYLIATSPKGKPPHLRTIAPQRALSDLYRDIVYTGGILTGSFGVIWAGGTTAYNAVGADPTTSPDPEIAGHALVDHLGNDPMLLTYLNRPFDSPFYRDSSVIFRLARLDLPVFHLAGLYDAFTRGQLQAIGRLLELERAGKVRGPNYAVVGPWNHGDSHFLDHPPYDRRILDWYRHWLDGAPRPAWFSGPRIDYCLMLEARNGPCQWRGADRWPPPRIAYTPQFLTAEGGLSARRPSGDGEVGSWTYNPAAGQGEDGFSKWDNAAGVPQRDADQAQEDEWKGITFTTPPLERDLNVAGPITLHLEASTTPLAVVDPGLPLDRVAGALGHPGAAQVSPPYHDTDFVAKLADVSPDGRSTLIQSGFLRASHRALDRTRTRTRRGRVTEPFHPHDPESLAPPTPGRRLAYEIEVWPTAKRFPAGHRLRLALYSADTANHLTLLKPAANRVFAGSYLLLPVARGGTGAARPGARAARARAGGAR
jgi:putative CocE/NonD family hydrolase